VPHGAPDIAEGHAAERGACASGFSAFRDPLTDSDDANYGHRRRPSPDRRELRHGRGRVRAIDQGRGGVSVGHLLWRASDARHRRRSGSTASDGPSSLPTVNLLDFLRNYFHNCRVNRILLA